jgi:hypothetical protein
MNSENSWQAADRLPLPSALRWISMAHYLVRAKPKLELLDELRERLHQHAFVDLRPFGRALAYSLTEARIERDGIAIWEEEDYCSPPLAQERAAVLDSTSTRSQ